MSRVNPKISEFWKYVRKNIKELGDLSIEENPAYDQMVDHLQKINEELWIEFMVSDEGSHFIITADGATEHFDEVEAIVAAAPEIAGWHFVALKPQIGYGSTVQWEETVVNTADVVFEPVAAEDTDELGILFYIPGLPEADIEDAHNALLRAIDHGLGERRFAESIYFTEVLPFPEDGNTEDYLPLESLEDYLVWYEAGGEEIAAEEED